MAGNAHEAQYASEDTHSVSRIKDKPDTDKGPRLGDDGVMVVESRVRFTPEEMKVFRELSDSGRSAR